MNRRRFLQVATLGAGGLAGCAGGADTTRTPGPSPTGTTTAPRGDPDTIHVNPAGHPSNQGTVDAPLATIQGALEEAMPGETVQVRPGRYHEVVRTVRPGRPDDPITVTGPPEAVYVGGDETPKPEPFEIMHSHVRVTGLTFDGLQDPDDPDDIDSYAKANLSVDPIGRVEGDETPPIVSDVVLKPHAVGNTLGNCMHVFMADGVEVGECRVHGPAGVAHFVFDEPGHDGEFVYIGTAPHGWEDRWNGHVDRPAS